MSFVENFVDTVFFAIALVCLVGMIYTPQFWFILKPLPILYIIQLVWNAQRGYDQILFLGDFFLKDDD